MNVRLTKEQKIRIANSDDVFTIMQAILKRENKLSRQKEHFWVIGLTTAHVIEFIELVALGSLNKAVIEPLDVFHLASAKNIRRIILVHNHPSGNLTPSAEDINLTHQLKQGGQLLKIDILDHLIISETGFTRLPV
ncbi:MAG TPA: JAB domain-containing protein [Bacteroidia bacterium]|nr:JAB domain-containing protein [Bacteroidia bacterium]